MPNLNDYHGYKSTSGGSGNGGDSRGGGPGCGFWVIIGIIFFFFIISGASWEAIETLLAFGFIAYLILK